MTTTLQNDFPAIYGKLMSSYGLAEAAVGFIAGQLKRNNGSLMALKANMVTNVARTIYSTDYRNERSVGEIKSDLRDMRLYELGALNYALAMGVDFEFGFINNDEAPYSKTIDALLREIQAEFSQRSNPVADDILSVLISEYSNEALN